MSVIEPSDAVKRRNGQTDGGNVDLRFAQGYAPRYLFCLARLSSLKVIVTAVFLEG